MKLKLLKKSLDLLLARLARLKNRRRFWQQVKSLKNKREDKEKIGIPIDVISEYYKNFFIDDRVDHNSEHTKQINRRIAEYQHEVSTSQSDSFFELDDLKNAIKEAKSSNTKGFDGISYNMLKKCNSYALEIVLLAFYNLILTNKKLPKHFNTSIISPITKDPKKDLNDVNNIRPISISNSLSLSNFRKINLIYIT